MDVSTHTIARPDIQEVNPAPVEISPGGVAPRSDIKEVGATPKVVDDRAGGLKKQENQAAAQLTRDDVEEMVEALEEMTQTLQTKLNFSINEGTNDIVVKVLDKDTDEVIKQFPPEELLELQEKMQDLTGFLFSADA